MTLTTSTPEVDAETGTASFAFKTFKVGKPVLLMFDSAGTQVKEFAGAKKSGARSSFSVTGLPAGPWTFKVASKSGSKLVGTTNTVALKSYGWFPEDLKDVTPDTSQLGVLNGYHAGSFDYVTLASAAAGCVEAQMGLATTRAALRPGEEVTSNLQSDGADSAVIRVNASAPVAVQKGIPVHGEIKHRFFVTGPYAPDSRMGFNVLGPVRLKCLIDPARF